MPTRASTPIVASAMSGPAATARIPPATAQPAAPSANRRLTTGVEAYPPEAGSGPNPPGAGGVPEPGGRVCVMTHHLSVAPRHGAPGHRPRAPPRRPGRELRDPQADLRDPAVGSTTSQLPPEAARGWPPARQPGLGCPGT